MVTKLNPQTGFETNGTPPWLGSDESSTVQHLRSLASRSDEAEQHEGFIRDLLQQTHSNRVRNAAAIALADLRLTHAADDLIAVLRRPDVLKASGTLIYALDELGASIPLCVLTTVLEQGSYEARAQALFFFEEHRVTHGHEVELRDGRHALSALALSEDPEAAEAARVALGFLEAGEPASEG